VAGLGIATSRQAEGVEQAMDDWSSGCVSTQDVICSVSNHYLIGSLSNLIHHMI
jgi:hypothetical protein